ncbi:MAG: hypothetical protein WC761_02430 [Candidatus Paceibacterota bacterium]|jgi:hypothetical protein
MVRLEHVSTGFTVATFSGVLALVWIFLVMTGNALTFVNSFLRLTFIVGTVSIAHFEFSKAFSLLGIAIVVGFVFGYLFASIWNYYRPY